MVKFKAVEDIIVQGTTVSAGEEVELTAEEAAQLGDKVVPAEEAPLEE